MHDFAVRFPLPFHVSRTVDFYGGTHLSVPHELLSARYVDYARNVRRLYDRIFEQTNRVNADPDHITAGERKVVTRNDACASHEKNTMRKCIVTE